MSVLLVTLAIVERSAGQSRVAGADLVGSVVDQTDAALPDTAIVATNVETGAVRTVVTDGRGRFVLPALAPGRYTLRVSKAGFAERVIEGVALRLGAEISVPITLAVDTVRAEVSVDAAHTTPHALQSHVVDRRQMQELPINGRNFITFALLSPGVADDRTPQQGISLNSGLTFGGQHARSNNVTVDGLDNNEFTIGAVREHFSQDAVREFQILTGGYPAEFGKASGGVVNIVTRSGTNAHAGSVFGYFRDESLNAKGYFEKFDPSGRPIDRTKAPYGQMQFGGTVGGPLRHDRVFYFGAFERLDVSSSNFVAIDDQTPVSHPTLAVTLGTPADILRNAGFEVETGHVPYALTSTQALGRIDVRLPPRHDVAVRFNWMNGRNENIEPFGGLVARSRGGASRTTQFASAGSLTSVVSGRAVNELRGQVSTQEFGLEALDPRCGGRCLSEDQGGPTVEVIGVASVGRLRIAPATRHMTRTQVVNTFSYYRGAHQVKTGADVGWINLSKYALPVNVGGRFVFAPLPATPGLLPTSLSAIQAVALGFPAAYVQGYGNSSTRLRYQDLSLFLQDEWRVASRLTVSGGLRYQTQFWPARTYEVPGYPGGYRFPVDRNDIAPRLAAAWQPTAGHNVVVHAAYGMFFENTLGVLYTIPAVVDGDDGLRTRALRLPGSIAAWRAPDRRLNEPAPGSYPSVRITVDPALRTPYAHHLSAGITHAFGSADEISVTATRVRGFNLVGTVDLNPVVLALGPGRRPEDVNGIAGTSASILQYTSFGETWYRALLASWRKRLGADGQLLASYTLSTAEDTATDFQSAFIVQNNGRGRNRADLTALPVGFDPLAEKGPAIHDQRHRLVVSGVFPLPAAMTASAILSLGSGRPFNILAGEDVNGDGDGGAFPADRARVDPADPATSVVRNSGRTPGYRSVDVRVSRRFDSRLGAFEAMVEVFNLFNRTNFTDVNNIFGAGPYPDRALPSFGTYIQAAAPRQVQLAVRWTF